MADLNLNTVELVTTLRTAPMNGSPSSSDYNEGQRETLVDLAALAGFINDTLLPLINALPSGALLPLESPIGIEGRTLWSDTSDQSLIFFDALSNAPLTIADSLRVVNGILGNNSQKLTDLGVEVASLQARLSSTNQNDIALALQNLSSSLNAITVGQTDTNASIGSLQGRVTTLETEFTTISSTVGASPFVGDTGSGGIQGLVPAPSAGSAAAGAFLSANGTFIVPAVSVGTPVINKTTNYTLQTSDSGTLFTNNGAGGEVDFTLPTGVAGLKYSFYIDSVHVLKVIAAAGDKIRFLATLSGTAGNIQATTQGNRVVLLCIGTSGTDGVREWIVDAIYGSWTIT